MIRLLQALAIAAGFSVFGTKALIEFLRRREIGQPIREDGPDGHATKAGTPTMGGLAIVGGALVGYLASDIIGSLTGDQAILTRSGLLVMGAIVGTGLVGLADDWIAISHERNRGLTKRAKMFGLLTVAITFSVLLQQTTSVDTRLSFVHAGSPGIELGEIVWVIFAVLVISGFSNAVNLTDGLDGLAAGAGTFCFGAFVVIGYWQSQHQNAYNIEHALDLAIVAAAMVGACVGFLWWNAAPAQIFMGDTGSLAIGTGLAALALATDTYLLLPIIGGLFVVETVSVILQVASFRLFNGKRIFRMAPIHHHYELGGWPETRVIIRFWLLSGLCTAIGVGLFYSDAISRGLVE